MSFKDPDGRESHKKYYYPTVEIEDYNVMIDRGNFFDQPIRNDLKAYGNIRKIVTFQDDDCTTGCFLDYLYFKKYYKLIAIDLSKQQKVDADAKSIKQIEFTGDLDRAEGSTMFLIIEKAERDSFRIFKTNS